MKTKGTPVTWEDLAVIALGMLIGAILWGAMNYYFLPSDGEVLRNELHKYCPSGWQISFPNHPASSTPSFRCDGDIRPNTI